MVFFPSLFSLLNKKKISYAVLRNYDDLPQKPLAGSDVDLLINKQDKDNYLSIVKMAADQSRSFILLKSDRSNCLSFFIYQEDSPALGFWLDAFTEISSKSFIWGDSDFLLKTRIFNEEKKFFTLSKGAEAATIFVKEIFSSSFIKERYRLKIPDFVASEKQNFIETIRPYFGEKISEEMADTCKKGDWTKAVGKRRVWFCQLIFKSFMRRPIGQKIDLCQFLSGYLKWRLRIKGISIAVIGPDGVGKTTACDKIGEDFKKLFFKKIHRYHAHFGFFPELNEIYGLFFPKNKQKQRFSTQKKVGFPRALMYIFYYGLEYFLAWPWVLLLKINGDMLIFDRYFYDFAAMNTISSLSLKFFKAVASIIPRPDTVFIMQASSEIVYSRKQELNREEIERRNRAFQEKRITKLAPTFLIDSSETPEEIFNKMEEEILFFLSKKNF